MTTPHITELDDGSIDIEWVLDGARAWISIEADPEETNCGYVSCADVDNKSEYMSDKCARAILKTLREYQLLIEHHKKHHENA